jgi:hypothetical protein
MEDRFAEAFSNNAVPDRSRIPAKTLADMGVTKKQSVYDNNSPH